METPIGASQKLLRHPKNFTGCFFVGVGHRMSTLAQPGLRTSWTYPQFLHTVSAFNFVEIEAQIFQSKQTRPGGSLCSCMKALRLCMQTVCPAIFSLRYAGNRDLLYCGCLPYACRVNCHVGNSSVVQCTSSLKMSSTEFSMHHSTSNSMGPSLGPQRGTTTLPSTRCLV